MSGRCDGRRPRGADRTATFRAAVFSFAFLVSAPALFGEGDSIFSGLSFSAAPFTVIPLGPGQDYLLPGEGAELSAEYDLGILPGLSLSADLLYAYMPIVSGQGSTSQLAASLGAAWRLPIIGRLSARAFARAGFGLGILNNDPGGGAGGSFAMEGGAGFSYAYTREMTFRLDASYLYFMGADGALKLSAGISIAPFLSPETGRASSLEISEISVKPVFPALRSFHASHPIGKVVIKNTGGSTLFDVDVTCMVPGFMQAPAHIASIAALGPGETREIPFAASFSSAVLDVREAQPAVCEVTASYVENGGLRQATGAAEVEIEAINAIQWDDAAKAASFVLPSDAAVRDLSSRISAAAREAGGSETDGRVRFAIALQHALRLAGVRYEPNSGTPFARASVNTDIIAPIQFPRRTLSVGGGDRPDLAVLCASLFEAAGMESALITLPGKICVAINVDGTFADGSAVAADLVTVNGRTWLPMEPDSLSGTFRDSWRKAASEWNEAGRSAELIPVRDAWLLYPPAAPPADDSPVRFPERSLVFSAAADEVKALTGLIAAPARADATAGAGPSVRRILVAIDTKEIPVYPDTERAGLALSLALALKAASNDIAVLEPGSRPFPDTPEKRIETAGEMGADGFVIVSLSGDAASTAVTVRCYDLLSRTVTADQSLAPDEGLDASDLTRLDWGQVVSIVLAGFPSREDILASSHASHEASLSIRARPGSVITGLPGGPVSVGDDGVAAATAPAPGTYALRATLWDTYPARESVFVDSDRDVALAQEPASRWSIGFDLYDALFPGMDAEWFFVPNYAFLKAGMTVYHFGLELGSEAVLFYIPLVDLFLDAGVYFNAEDDPARFYLTAGGFLRLDFPSASIVQIDALSPGGVRLSAGAEYPISMKLRLYVQWMPQVFFSAYPELFHAAIGPQEPPPGYIFTRWGAFGLFNIGFGFRWHL